MALGTPYYMAPEQAQGVRDIDHRADIYSVGIILYQALAGRLPFDAESYPALLLKIMSERPAPLRVFRNDVPEALEQVVMQAMARDRDVRFQTIEALSEALQRFAVVQTLPPSSYGPGGHGSATPVPAGMHSTARSTAASMPQTTPFVTAHDHPAKSGAPTAAPASNMRALIGVGAAIVVLGGVAAVWFSGTHDPASTDVAEHIVAPAAVHTAQAAQPVTALAPAQHAPALQKKTRRSRARSTPLARRTSAAGPADSRRCFASLSSSRSRCRARRRSGRDARPAWTAPTRTTRSVTAKTGCAVSVSRRRRRAM
jgi:serine/threonine-protein kinase